MPSGGYSTGLCNCCALPGGCLHCLCGYCCLCVQVGINNHWTKGPCGFWGGCLGFLLTPFFYLGGIIECIFIFMQGQETIRITKGPEAAAEIGCCNHCLKAWFCSCCYALQIRREQLIHMGVQNKISCMGELKAAQDAAYGRYPTWDNTPMIVNGVPTNGAQNIPVAPIAQGAPMERQGAPAGQQQEDPEAIWTSEFDPESLEQVPLMDDKRQ